MKTALFFWLAFGFTAHAKIIWEPLPPDNYEFGRLYPEAQSLLFGFDYGHAMLYDRLMQLRAETKPGDDLEQKYDETDKELLAEITELLKKQMEAKADEETIARKYAESFAVPLSLFNWSHYLHQFTYDLFATAKTPEEVVARTEAIYEKYISKKELVISQQCLKMSFMDNQVTEKGKKFSEAFREHFPKMNELIWSYHWFQISIYTALLKPPAERKAAMAATVAGFWKKVARIPGNFNDMPTMLSAAPKFGELSGSKKNPKLFAHIANVFDNLHMLHDILSDILVSEEIEAKDMETQAIKFSGLTRKPPEKFFSTKCQSDQKPKEETKK